MPSDAVDLLISEAIDVPDAGRIARVQVWSVPVSEAYPDGIKYRMHYGTTEGETIVRYDNSHGATKGHERHTSDGIDDEYTYPGSLEAVLSRFRSEVRTDDDG